MNTLRYFSMFSGIGGFEIGIERAAESQGIPVECVGYSEIEKNAIKIYERHWPEHVNYGDATEIDPEDIPDFDLLVAGFPCQPFSIAGEQRGFGDTRGTLFFDIARILERKRPRHFILENVKNLVSHDKGRTFRVIIKALDELGYLVEWQVLNAKDFGVPQNRERIIIVGHLGGLGGRAVLPFTGEGHPHRPQGQRPSSEGGVERFGVVRNNFPGKPEVFVEREHGIATTLDANYAKGLDNHGARTGIAEFPVVQDIRRGLPKGVFQEREIVNTLKTNYGNGFDNHGSKTGVGEVSHGRERVRRLTPIECERLQGFPDNWTEGVSDSARYKACGNAVPTVLIEAVSERLLEGWA